MLKAALLFTCLCLAACGGSNTPPEAPGEGAPPSLPEVQPTPTPPGDTAKRPELTAEACQAGGGTVVGDIGDGAIHRPDYRCPSGAAPSGTIRAAEGGPIAVEGSVCCPQ